MTFSSIPTMWTTLPRRINPSLFAPIMIATLSTRNYVFQGKYATGIEDIHVISDEGESGKQGIFDLQGRQLNADPTHGIYIKNGKKYVK